MGLITYEKIVLVQPSFTGGMEIQTFVDELDMVLRLMDNGAIGGGVGYGNPAHLEALWQIQRRVTEVLHKIKAHHANETEIAEES